MASLRIIQAAVDRRTADPAHKELLKFVQVHCPGIVQKEQGKVFYFDAQLERNTPELRITNAAVDDFLSVCSLLLYLCSSHSNTEKRAFRTQVEQLLQISSESRSTV